MNIVNDLSEMQLSALSEIGNIGSGHAAIALSQLAGHKIMVAVTGVKVMEPQGFHAVVGGPETLVAGIYLRVLGDAMGSILFALPRDSAHSLVDVVMHRELGTTKILGELEQSCLKETGSIVGASYLVALSKFMKIVMIPSVPRMAVDRIDVVVDSVLGDVSQCSGALMGIETAFIEAKTEIKGYFLFMLDAKGMDIFLKALGV